MSEIITEKRIMTLICIILYIFGACLFGVGLFVIAVDFLNIMWGIFPTLAGATIIHSTAKNMGKKLEISIAGIEKFLMVIILLELTVMALVPAPCTWIASP